MNQLFISLGFSVLSEMHLNSPTNFHTHRSLRSLFELNLLENVNLKTKLNIHVQSTVCPRGVEVYVWAPGVGGGRGKDENIGIMKMGE